VGENLRRRLGVQLRDQSQCASESAAFGVWKRQVEDLGVFVFQTSGVDVEEMRGFALANALAPVIVVNSADSYTAKSFTLIHELAHLLFGVSAVYAGRPTATEPQDKIERFCNGVAAEVLVPRADFISRMPSDWNRDDDNAISTAARLYRVSRLVIGLRLVETGLADSEYLRTKWPLLQSKRRKPDTSGPIPRHTLTLSRAGESFTKLALAAYYANDIHGGDLTELLDMKLKHLPKLEARLYPNRIQPLLKAE
jgi:Zn-dependent peptidase ImmA (M78 family)